MNKVRVDIIHANCFITEAKSNLIVANCNVVNSRFTHEEQKRHANFIVKASNSYSLFETTLMHIAKMPCLAKLLGEFNSREECSCASCMANMTLEQTAK